MRGFHFSMGGDQWRVKFTRTIPDAGQLDADECTVLVNPKYNPTMEETLHTILHELDHYPVLMYEGTRLTYRKQERIVREQEANRREAMPQVLRHLGLPPWP